MQEGMFVGESSVLDRILLAFQLVQLRENIKFWMTCDIKLDMSLHRVAEKEIECDNNLNGLRWPKSETRRYAGFGTFQMLWQTRVLEQCSSTFLVMVHPLRCFDELMNPIYLNPCTLFIDASPTYLRPCL